MTTPRTDLLARVNTFPAHYVQVYLVTVTAVDAAAGTCTVDPGDGATVAEVPYYGTPTVGTATVLLLFDGQLALLGLT